MFASPTEIGRLLPVFQKSFTLAVYILKDMNKVHFLNGLCKPLLGGMMKRFWELFAEDQDGATAIEYALMAGLVSLAVVTAMSEFTGAFNGLAQRIADAVPAMF